MPRKKPASKTGRENTRPNIQHWIRDTIANEGQVARIPAKIAAILQCSVSGVQNAFKTLEGAGVIRPSDGDSQVYVAGKDMNSPQLPVETPEVDHLAGMASDHEALKFELMSAYQRIIDLEKTCSNLRTEICQFEDVASAQVMFEAERRIEELRGE